MLPKSSITENPVRPQPLYPVFIYPCHVNGESQVHAALEFSTHAHPKQTGATEVNLYSV
jgi:hypothetical protein